MSGSDFSRAMIKNYNEKDYTKKNGNHEHVIRHISLLRRNPSILPLREDLMGVVARDCFLCAGVYRQVDGVRLPRVDPSLYPHRSRAWYKKSFFFIYIIYIREFTFFIDITVFMDNTFRSSPFQPVPIARIPVSRDNIKRVTTSSFIRVSGIVRVI